MLRSTGLGSSQRYRATVASPCGPGGIARDERPGLSDLSLGHRANTDAYHRDNRDHAPGYAQVAARPQHPPHWG